MKWMKGIVLFLIANLFFMVAINVIVIFVLPVFGITWEAYTASLLTYGFRLSDLRRLHQFGVFEADGACDADNCQQITQPRSHVEQMIYGSVQEIARRLNITMPEVWVYESPDPNAFATGPSKEQFDGGRFDRLAPKLEGRRSEGGAGSRNGPCL